VVAAPPGVMLPFVDVEVLPLLRVRVLLVPFDELVVLVVLEVEAELLRFRLRPDVVLAGGLPLVVLAGGSILPEGLAVNGAVGSFGVPEAALPVFAVPVFEPGAAAVPLPVDVPEGFGAVVCAITALINVAQAANVTSRSAFIGLLFIGASLREMSHPNSDGITPRMGAGLCRMGAGPILSLATTSNKTHSYQTNGRAAHASVAWHSTRIRRESLSRTNMHHAGTERIS
jgi:hypothetical protein